ncbi:MAG: hypothetical protein GC201_07885 [Alphaproteobacteria bacterium]|nr:hypothetical protein [Alphaproteobacteria bacterium]
MSTPSITVTPDSKTVMVTATSQMPTTFMKLLGVDAMTVSASSTVIRNGRGVELVLVMDNTGSMRSAVGGSSTNKITAMKNAAKKLVDILYNGRETIDNFYVELVPYAAMVNIGNNNTGWVTRPGGGDWAWWANSVYYSGTIWKGCVMARADPYDETDDPPSVAKWEVMAWSSTKDITFKDKYGNDIRVRKNGNWQNVAGDNNWPPIDESNNAQNNGTGPNLGCPPAITPLIQDKTDVDTAIDQMQPWHRGGTMSNLGLAWGWRVISPRWRGLWNGVPEDHPLDYNTPNWDKVVILLTDGTNEWYDWDGDGHKGDDGKTPLNGLPGKAGFSSSSSANVKSGDVPDDTDYGAYGRISANRLGTTSNGSAHTVLDNKMKRMCTFLRQNGVIVYTLTFGATSSSTEDTFEQCAGRPDRYFASPTNEDLESAFIAIATEINNLRISE